MNHRWKPASRIRATARYGALASAVAAAVLLTSETFAAQTYPNRVVTLVTSVSAGGSIDAVARLIASGLSKSLGQPVVVEPRPGSGGNIAAGYVAHAAADGHILLLASSATLTTNPHVYKTVPFDSERSFIPVIMPARINQILVVNPKVPASDLQGFVALMKEQPGKLNYGSSGIGAASHLAAEILGLQTGTRATHVPYRGLAPAINDLLAGNIDFVFDSAITVQHVQSGKLRALAVVGPSRVAALPDVKTFKELGVHDMEVANSWYALAAPAGTPREIIQTLNDEITKILKLPATMDAIRAMGLEPTLSTPEEMATVRNRDFQQLGAIAKQIQLTTQ